MGGHISIFGSVSSAFLLFFSGNFVFFSENGAWEFGDEGGGKRREWVGSEVGWVKRWAGVVFWAGFN